MMITNLIKAIVIPLSIFASVVAAYAQTKVVVIPMSGDDLRPLSNIVTVAKENGDFSDPVEAVNSITDASASNPYLVVIAPGSYAISEALQMKEWVSIAGSGEKVTSIVRSFTDSSGVQQVALGCNDNSSVSDMTIRILNPAGDATGVYCSGLSNLLFERLAIDATGKQTRGMYLHSSSSDLREISITASGELKATGLSIINVSNASSPSITNITVQASGGSVSNIGIDLDTVLSGRFDNVTASASSVVSSSINVGIRIDGASVPEMNYILAKASGGDKSTGLEIDLSSPRITKLTASGAGAYSSNYGLYTGSGGNVTLHGSTLEGSGGAANYGAYIDNSTVSMDKVTANGLGGGNVSYGLYINSTFSNARIHGSSFAGETAGVRMKTSKIRMSDTRIDGGVMDNPSGIQCVNAYDSNFNNVSC